MLGVRPGPDEVTKYTLLMVSLVDFFWEILHLLLMANSLPRFYSAKANDEEGSFLQSLLLYLPAFCYKLNDFGTSSTAGEFVFILQGTQTELWGIAVSQQQQLCSQLTPKCQRLWPSRHTEHDVCSVCVQVWCSTLLLLAVSELYWGWNHAMTACTT